jgi:uncharacterized membrane protein YkgB
MRNAPNKELLTMEEKMKLNPNEIMENGLTREHNEKIENDGNMIQGLMGIVSIVVGIYCILQVL